MARIIFVSLLAALACAGCSSPSSQIASCQADKEQLLATIREQRDANRTMHEQVASLERRLDESEKELARRGAPTTKLSSAKPVKDEHLPWRSPESLLTESSKAAGTRGTKAQGGSLAALAARDERLKLDSQSGIASLNIDALFPENSAQLTAAGKRELDRVAKLLRSKEAAELRVTIAGSAARARAVADYLDSHGIANERLAVADVAQRVAASGATNHNASQEVTSGVQILLAQPETPVIGRTTGAGTQRR
jgi:outer membrane protein OmpA-like peptidoglycan-associated protein